MADQDEQKTEVPVAEEAVDAEIEDLKNKILRLQADFDNYRKRTTRARADSADETRRDTVAAFLPVYDHFLRALQQAEQSPELLPFLSGFEMILQQMDQTFAQLGMELIDARTGAAFDPNVHEATGMIPPGDDSQPDTIAQELQKGFTYKGLVVRPARVLVFSAATA